MKDSLDTQNQPSHDAGDTRKKAIVWFARIAFAAVFVINVQCALQYVIWPQLYTSGFGLAGIPGNVAVRGLGVAFLMWNATYPAVIWNPLRFKALSNVVIAQQIIGLAGELAILLSLPAGFGAISASITRFVWFDAAGLVLMAIARIGVWRVSRA